MIQPASINGRANSSRKTSLITVRLDQPTKDEINFRIPGDYQSLSALVRAGIDEILANSNPSNSRASR